MTHETIRVGDVHNFEWFTTRREALEKVFALQREGIVAKYGCKRINAPTWRTYFDLETAAIYQGKYPYDMGNKGKSWVVAW